MTEPATGAIHAEDNVKLAVGLAPLLIALSAAALLVLGASPIAAAVAVTAWGFAFGGVPVGLQTWLVRAAPDQAESAGGLMVATFQVVIALRAIVGGLLVDHAAIASAFAYGDLARGAGGFRKGPEAGRVVRSEQFLSHRSGPSGSGRRAVPAWYEVSAVWLTGQPPLTISTTHHHTMTEATGLLGENGKAGP